ncbi:hypothetical protein RD792_011317 [Penstemon davidsonii]|uniref:histidine kinase n=1 Tax=Penstemon davidsonii TaxID=160366 RepID=A0ABR0D4G6_9LAMI|nr:hypothetical protein RD792_011317 [Penstemon davidsonii]
MCDQRARMLQDQFSVSVNHVHALAILVSTFHYYKNPSAIDQGRYLGGAFDVESLVENLLGQLAGNQAIVVNVYDITNSSDPLIMYEHQSQDGDMSLKHVSSFDFGDPFRKTRDDMSLDILIIVQLSILLELKMIFHKMQELKVQAEAADVAKSQFLATVSHEIRTPMNGILGMLALLIVTGLSSTQRDYAQTAQARGEALITLINEVLDRAKIESRQARTRGSPI